MDHLSLFFLQSEDLPNNLPTRLVETFDRLGLPHEADSRYQRLDSPTTDQKVLVDALEKGGALYRKYSYLNGPDGRNPRQEIGMSYTTSLADEDGQHYQLKWVFSRLEHLIWVQCKATQ